MVHLTKIYTRTGDDGTTSLADGSRTSKFSSLLYAIGSIDEANAAIGCIADDMTTLDAIQNDLFDIGAELANSSTVKITQERIDWLESMIDYYNEFLEPLNSFVLPKGMYHLARTAVRRAERDAWIWFTTDAEDHIKREISQLPLIYLNRLSDLLFVMARYNSKFMEVLWKPMTEN